MVMACRYLCSLVTVKLEEKRLPALRPIVASLWHCGGHVVAVLTDILEVAIVI